MKAKKHLLLLSLIFSVFLFNSCTTTTPTTKVPINLPEIDLTNFPSDLSIDLPKGKSLKPDQIWRAPQSGSVVLSTKDWETLNQQLDKAEGTYKALRKKIIEYSKSLQLKG